MRCTFVMFGGGGQIWVISGDNLADPLTDLSVRSTDGLPFTLIYCLPFLNCFAMEII